MYTDFLEICGFVFMIRATDAAVTEVSRCTCGQMRPNRMTDLCKKQLEEYFLGARKNFDFPAELRGTPFQLAVWQVLQEIPWGEKVSYGEVARRLGKPKAARAVGGAVGKNPVLIAVPCHRVVGAGGMGGFSAGLDLKEALLKREGLL